MQCRTVLAAFALVVLSGTCAVAQTPAAASGDARAPYIVSPAWLAEHLNDPSLVLLHVGDRESYDAAHLPGAQWVPYMEIGTRQEGALTLELPPVEQLQALFERLGVSDNSRIILYMGTDWASPTTRVFLTLEYLGLGEHASILDGGLPAWRAAGQPVTTEVRAAAPGKLTPRPRNDVVVDAAWVNAHLTDASVAIVDARHTRFYEGDPGRMPRGGHIAGARSVPFVSLLEESGKYKDAGVLAEAFRAAGVPAGSTVVTYCHIGQQASLVWFVARMLGYNARMYDGSFEDWSRRAELPVEPATQRLDPRHDNNPPYDLAAMYRHHFMKVNDEFWTGGQPPLDELARLKADGIKTVIVLRKPGEQYFDAAAEEAEAKRLGLRYFLIPVDFANPKEEQADEFLKLTDDAKNRPAFIHCAMAVRVGAFWMIRRVLRDGWSVDDAEAEAEKIGLGSRHLKKFARDYIAKHQKQPGN